MNRNIARPRGLHLDVYRWETDAHPGFHPEGPQGLIDPILKIEDCDILIGIFWRRFGTPVSDAKSGTEHEFRLAYEAWKKTGKPQIMVYFCQRKYIPQSKEETDQAGLVLQFKKDFPREGLWWDYKNKAEFETVVRNHLTKLLSEKFPINPTPAPATQTPLTPLFQLPPPPADFTGRTTELAELRAAIEKGGVNISGLQGQGGVGKTALALKLAAELAPKYHDAQIYLDLKGVSEKPLTAAEAMSHVLRTFHPEARLPEKEEDLRALYLSVLHGKRALLLMDNAKDAAQVRPLIPPTGCAMIVTSRLHFALPGLQAKNLETLSSADAEELLLVIAPRIGAESAPIAKLCGYLPLALRLAASAIAVRVDLCLHDYLAQLADEKRLKLLSDGEESIEASINLSYRLLNSEKQTMWRMLAVFPDTFDVPGAAAIWKIETGPARDALGDLLQLSILEWNDVTKRYRLHDLMRDFARSRSTIVESESVARIHANRYAVVLARSDHLYRKGGDSLASGLALFDLEWGNIRAGQDWAATHSEDDREAAKLCSDYSDWGAFILGLRQHPRDRPSWHEAALGAARRLGNRAVEGIHLTNLGIARKNLGDSRQAIEHHEQRLTIAHEAGDRRGEASALGNLGITYSSLGDYPRAIEYFEKALAISRGTGDRRGEGYAVGNLGTAYFYLGDLPRAIAYQEQHLAIAREVGDRRGEGNALGGLGMAYAGLGNYPSAVEYGHQHLAIAREIGHRLGESNALGNLGVVNAKLGKEARALTYYEQKLAIARDIGDRSGEGTTLLNMSISLDKLGERKRAIEHAEGALKILEQIEDPNAAAVKKQLDIWKNG